MPPQLRGIGRSSLRHQDMCTVRCYSLHMQSYMRPKWRSHHESHSSRQSGCLDIPCPKKRQRHIVHWYRLKSRARDSRQECHPRHQRVAVEIIHGSRFWLVRRTFATAQTAIMQSGSSLSGTIHVFWRREISEPAVRLYKSTSSTTL